MVAHVAQDIAFRRSPLQFIFGRGTIRVFADAAANDNEIHFSKYGARSVYYKLRQSWTNARIGFDEGS